MPRYVEQEFEAYLKCGRLEEGFLRVRCESCHAEKLLAFSCKRRGFCPSCAANALTEGGYLRYALKTAYRDGTTHVLFEPMDFIARLAALVPKPGAHLTRFHGVFAPHSALRDQVVPQSKAGGRTSSPRTEGERHRTMTWATRLKRVFAIEIDRTGPLKMPVLSGSTGL